MFLTEPPLGKMGFRGSLVQIQSSRPLITKHLAKPAKCFSFNLHMHFWTPEGRPAQSGIVPPTKIKAELSH